MPRRSFQRRDESGARRWEISQEGIRCRMSWGLVGGTVKSSTMTLDDEAHAQRHFRKKIAEKKRQGYVEVQPEESSPATGSAGVATLLEIMRAKHEPRYAGAWEFFWSGHEPLPGYPGSYVKFYDFPPGPGPQSMYEYLLLSVDQRRGVEFRVRQTGYVAEEVAAFLAVVAQRLALPFDGASHHKVPLPAPIGGFGHALFCAPSLNNDRYESRLGWAFPIFDCEIADQDTESFVQARITGRDALPMNDWDRSPAPVLDLRFDLRRDPARGAGSGRWPAREKAFKVYSRAELDRLLDRLPEATADSRVEIRNYRGAVLAVTPGDHADNVGATVDAFLLASR